MPKQQKKNNNNNMNTALALAELSVRSPKKKSQTKKKTNFNPVKALINTRAQEIEENVSKYIKNSKYIPNKNKKELLNDHYHLIRMGNGGFKEIFIKGLEKSYKKMYTRNELQDFLRLQMKKF